ncbi:ribosome biogenesis GTPase YlqF [Mariniblastus fucicola]|uniref:Ribosome biogenesis GTPase A n=1 Tax=Mariniblastus fucicola TaxID=980251 RepID=A0A5B9P6T7_9BACT|nr:ribosome biogenesis GTPase YlqF [Mariniblastus fucicola]QEG20366.1 Ribosome biogenesis GTPase A [Mariniblastus fucicola]
MSEKIQWFPGHMNKARNQFRDGLPKVHMVIEVLDARIPFSSQNPMLEELRGDKPVLKVLAKSDLADPERTKLWQEWFERQKGVRAKPISIENIPQILGIKQICLKMIPNQEFVKSMVVGVPNVGKSTLINKLAGRTIAKTGNEPAVTKSQQRINIGQGISLFDTPGMLWPNVENRHSGFRLASVGSVKDTALDYEEVAAFAGKFLLEQYPDRLVERYGFDSIPNDIVELFDAIGHKRGCLGKNAVVNYERVSRILITEFRSGKLGPITMETPDMVERELVELEKAKAEKAEKKQARDKKRKDAFKARNKNNR